ncbi:MAG: hypothetical protein CMD08_00050 [Flavobacteriales bacterium]|nr:hypothetical protein [Flavobacteriales bacterium]
MDVNLNQQEETIDIKELILKYTQYWHYFIFTILLLVFNAFLYTKFTIPQYSVSATLEIRDDNNTQLGAENIIEGLELFSGRKNLTNEIIILNSYSITEKVINELKLGVSYFQHGFFQTNELFENSPFIVKIDSTHDQLTEIPFIINIIDSNKFKLEVSTNDQFPYNLKSEKFNKTILANIDIDETHFFDKNINSEYYSFTISKSLFFKENEITERTYSFKIHEMDKLAHKLIENININPINKDASILKLNIKAKNPKKNIAILNKITEVYLRSGLDEKNIMAVNTINFINEQLNVIKDSLTIIENQLEKFRSKNPELKIVDKDFGTYFQKQKLDNTLSEQEINIKYYKSILKYLQNDNHSNSILSPTSIGISNPELNNLINQLLELYAKKDDLKLTTTEKNPAFKSVVSRIEHTKKSIIENLNNLIASASIYKNDLTKRINSFNANINQLPEAEKNYLILKRKYEYHEQTTIYLQQKKYEASLAKA